VHGRPASGRGAVGQIPCGLSPAGQHHRAARGAGVARGGRSRRSRKRSGRANCVASIDVRRRMMVAAESTMRSPNHSAGDSGSRHAAARVLRSCPGSGEGTPRTAGRLRESDNGCGCSAQPRRCRRCARGRYWKAPGPTENGVKFRSRPGAFSAGTTSDFAGAIVLIAAGRIS